MCSGYDYIAVTDAGCVHVVSSLDSSAATGNAPK